MLHKISVITVSFMACLFCNAQALHDSIPVDTILLNDGSLYMGQIADSLFNGHGTLIYADGTVYDGGWKDGLWDGQGTLVYPDGDIYKGGFRAHIKEGLGTYIYSSGARYDGEWKDDRFNGKGKLLFEDGGMYDGAWKDDMKHGYGQLTPPQGRPITGYFYYDEYLGWPHDTYIDIDSTLTDELKEWGFSHEPEEMSGDIYLGFSYSDTRIATLSLWLDYSDKFFWGMSVGFNLDPPTQGKYGAFGWTAYPKDVHMEGEYTSSIFTLDMGLKWKRLSLGGAAGIGLDKAYRNCKANGNYKEYTNYGLSYGEAYYMTTPTSSSFIYRAYIRYSIIIKNRPKALTYLGYGNSEGLFLGVGINL